MLPQADSSAAAARATAAGQPGRRCAEVEAEAGARAQSAAPKYEGKVMDERQLSTGAEEAKGPK